MPKRLTFQYLLVLLGYLLSPLSWWNDPFVNVPLAYLFALPFSAINSQLYLPSLILGYWLSNLVGFLFLHKGLSGILKKHQSSFSVLHSMVVTIIYTMLLVILVFLGWLPSPAELLHTVHHE